MPTPTRRSTSMTLDSTLLDEARALGINISRAAEAGIAAELKTARTEAWRRENAEAIRNYNDYISQNGLPLSQYRMF
jgi:antitoxin CcdA